MRKSAPAKLWNLGNTTLRNPNRIARGLSLFATEFQGKLYGEGEETVFARRLVEEGIVDSGGSEAAWLGRKWRSCFVKLGFATDKQYGLAKRKFSPPALAEARPELKLSGIVYELTPVGDRLLEAAAAGSATAIEDVYLRQLVRHEIPSPIETGFSGGQMKPFIYLLQVLRELQTKGEPGLNKIEIALFLQVFSDHTAELITNTVGKILEYRRRRGTRSGNRRDSFDRQLLGNVRETTRKRALDTPLDYADTTSRYSQLSGLLAWDGSRVVLRENKLDLIDAILAREPNFLASVDPFRYLADFYTGTSLPFDSTGFAIQQIQSLAKELTTLSRTPPPEALTVSPYMPIQDVEQIRYRLADQLQRAREEVFAAQQTQGDRVQEIIGLLNLVQNARKARNEGIFDPPAFLEWAVWRAFLAIDRITVPIHATRRFPLDQDLRPRDTAPANRADMVFEFEDFILVVEVTLTTSSRQEAAEGEPVRRHVADIIQQSNKSVYGLFLAPQIDTNTAYTFASGVWFGPGVRYEVNIVPLTLNQFRSIMDVFLKRAFSPSDFKRLLENCIASRDVDPFAWQQSITDQTIQWVRDTVQ